MEGTTTTVTANVPKFSGKLVLQATDQNAGGKFDELVLPQRGVPFERLNNIMNLSPVRLYTTCFSARSSRSQSVLYFTNLQCRTEKELVILLHR